MSGDHNHKVRQADPNQDNAGGNPHEALLLPEVFASELEEIRERRDKANFDLEGFDQDWQKHERPLSAKDRKALSESLVGLALSGGGIRSATFCLGLLQGLKRYGLLRIFDYLSTVSGGGYVGGWWSAWLSRDERIEKEGRFPPDEQNALEREAQRREEREAQTYATEIGENIPEGAQSAATDPVHHLRLFANYLTPRKGVLSRDTWRAVAVITRNLLMTWLVLVPIIVGLVLVGQLYFVLHPHPANNFIFYPEDSPPEISKQYIQARWEKDVQEKARKKLKSVFKGYLRPSNNRIMALENRYLSLGLESPKPATINDLRADVDWEGIYLIWSDGAFLTQAMKEDWKKKKQELTAQRQEGTTEQRAYHTQGLMKRLRFALEPFIAIAGWIALMVITWLVLTLRPKEKSDKLVIAASLLAVIAVVICLLDSYPQWFGGVTNWLSDPEEWGWIIAWLVGAAGWWVYAWQPWDKNEFPKGNEPEGEGGREKRAQLEKQWRNEAWRNRITSAHTKLLMLSVITAVVLAIAGFGHEMIKYPYLERLKLVRGGGLIIILAAVAGLIFTAYKITQLGGDKRGPGGLSGFSRLAFAVTPYLVVLVIAFAAAWVGHGVFSYIWREHLLGNEPAILRYGKYASFFGVAICFIFAMVEMKWESTRSTLWLCTAVALPALTALCVLYNLVRHIADPLNLLALVLCGIGGFIVFHHISRHASKSNGSRSGALARPSVLHGSNSYWDSTSRTPKLPASQNDAARGGGREAGAELKKNWRVLSRDAGLAEIVLALILICFYLYWFFYAAGKSLSPVISSMMLDQQRSFYAATILIAATLTGGCILFRLIIVRDKKRLNVFHLAIFRKVTEKKWKALAEAGKIAKARALAERRRKDSLWIAVAVCCSLAVTASCLIQGHLLSVYKESQKKSTARSKDLTSFQQRASRPAKPKEQDGIEGVIEKLNFVEQIFRRTGDYAPFCALPLATCLFAVGLFFCRKILAIIKARHHSHTPKPKWMSFIRDRRIIGLSVCAIACILIASSAIWMAIEVLSRLVSKDMNQSSFSHMNNFTPAGIALCLAFTRFEMKWGKHDNRRPLWLLTFAYLALIALLIYSLIPRNSHYRYEYGFGIVGLLATVFTWLIGLGWLASPNSSSMHRFYKWRLVRAYLGASNKIRHKRDKHITETAAGDDVLLNDLKNCERGAPYHLINTTLNLVAVRDLAIAQRSATSYLLSQKYCGSLRTGYSNTKDYMENQLSLGTAIAISGAAASPNMGSQTPTSALAMVMTLLNIRLGYWVPTPGKEEWKSAQPGLWPFYLIREFFSQTDDQSNYSYLTDGGHFDNTGLYSLVERGCRFIVVADCGADPLPCFSDLGNVIRRCRIDFGAEIEFDIEDFIKLENKQAVPRHFIVGKVLYSQKYLELLRGTTYDKALPEAEREGIIVLFKPSLMAEDKADIRQYALEHSIFPHTTTTNQWFDESQFESYRRLGELCAQSLFSKCQTARFQAQAQGEKAQNQGGQPEDTLPEPKLTPRQIKELFDEIQSVYATSCDTN